MQRVASEAFSSGFGDVFGLEGAVLHTRQGNRREDIESYIANHYAKTYGASVTEFLPLILEMSIGGKPGAALGMRPASCGTLFLEQYIDQSVEQCVAGEAHCPVGRGSLMEIGNLVATRKGSSLTLFSIMTAALYHGHYQWMVFTATPQVKKLIERLNYQPRVICDADPGKLRDNAGCWGSYYDSRPKLMLVDIEKGYQAIRSIPAMNQLLQSAPQLVETLGQQLRDHRRLCVVTDE